MAHKPSDDVRQLLDAAKCQPTTTAAREVVSLARSKIEVLEVRLRDVEAAIANVDLQTFQNAENEKLLVKQEIAELSHLREEALSWIASKKV